MWFTLTRHSTVLKLNEIMSKKLILITILICCTPLSYSQTKFTQDSLQFINLFNQNSDPEVACYRIPSLITAANGDLIAAIDERVPSCGDLKWSKDINIVIRRSEDQGKTWFDKEIVVDYPYGQSASDPSMILDTTTSKIFMFFNYMDLDTENNIYYLKVVSSVDNGKTWSQPKDITSQITHSNWHSDFKFITSGRGITTRSEKLLHTVVNLDKGLHVFGSDDHGKDWYVIETPIIPADESQIVELTNGSWMISSRVNGVGMRYKHLSKDEGKTWVTTPDKSLNDPGCNASIIRYSSVKEGDDKNRLIFSNVNSKDKRENLTVKISYDEGKSWTEEKTIYSQSAAYSSLCKLANGDIGLFFEANNYEDNFFVSFSLEWLTDGRDKLPQIKK